MVDFIQGNTLTEEGQHAVAFIEQQIANAVKLYEADGNFGHVESMSGMYKHYYMHVVMNREFEQAIMTSEQWVESYPYAMTGVYADLQQQQQQAENTEKIAEATEATQTLAEKFELLARNLQEAQALIEEQKQQIADLQETKSDKRRKSKSKSQETEEGDPPADTAAEGDTETESDD